MISALNTSKGLDIKGFSTVDGGNVQLWAYNARAAAKTNQQFKIEKVSGQWYHIVNVNSGKALDVYKNSDKNGANVQQCKIHNRDNQLWRFIPAGNGYYYIQSKKGLYLDVAGGKSDNGTNIQIWELNNTASQKFKLDKINVKQDSSIETKIKNQQDALVSYIKKNYPDGKSWPSKTCLGFVETCYQNSGFYKAVGVSRPWNCCAYYSRVKWAKAQSTSNIPIGASVFIDNGSYSGAHCKKNHSYTWADHIGIYIGGGKFVHASGGKIQTTNLPSKKNFKIYWGFAGVNPNSYTANSLKK